ncbi:alginate O-acetyltransferase AlgX-related protein [Derxia gummosa]|uniref:Alginate O-acetyltransferase AlgX-related protein n=1 Tax=Derxia gummosa DSM 723 TaxID=1121388 RepID=A0A8B6X510_9BURK|nr:hypothetical protein [Derxia gummosa]
MPSLIKNAIAIGVGIAAALLCGEIVLSAMPVNRAAWGALASNEWRGPRLEPNTTTYSTDWDMSEANRPTINKLGFHSTLEYTDGAPMIALLGDSYIQAMMIPDSQTIDGLLNARRADNTQIYNLGSSGAQLPTYTGQAAEAKRRYSPQGAVVLISRNDIYESMLPVTGFYNYRREGDDWLPPQYLPPDSRRSVTKQVAMHSSLLNYFRGNLKFGQTPVFKGGRPGDGADAPVTGAYAPMTSAECRPIYEHFLETFPGAAGLPPERVVLVFDGQRSLLYPTGKPSPAADTACLPEFAAAARAAGFGVVDLEPVFRAEYASAPRRFDYWPRDVHWNAEGHRIVAREIERELRDRGIWH